MQMAQIMTDWELFPTGRRRWFNMALAQFHAGWASRRVKAVSASASASCRCFISLCATAPSMVAARSGAQRRRSSSPRWRRSLARMERERLDPPHPGSRRRGRSSLVTLTKAAPGQTCPAARRGARRPASAEVLAGFSATETRDAAQSLLRRP